MPAAKKDSGAESVVLAGEGGVEWEFELPLSDTFLAQVRDGKLQPVDDAGAKKVAEAHPEPPQTRYVAGQPEENPHASPVKVTEAPEAAQD